jgi:ring-1,2-phenylacetyl-CoA epoxidase subunit PaaC
MLRQFLFDAAEAVRLAGLAQSPHEPLAEAAAKIRTEEIYHYRHTHAWVTRLGLGTAESHTRMQTALDALWAYALQLFVPLPGEAELAKLGLVPASAELQLAWEALVVPALTAAGLNRPAGVAPAAISREAHSAHLAPLLGEMQSVARLEGPQVQW